ncbi:MAG: N-carbamoylsarcosine amidase [Rhodospirillaceae bacterium]|nr:N-carbamoylsarcosine amidase [Rhodospirillaceae bacterium]|tara:strand:+ start:513 stop:1181 length:669 start_codon:yes stop_codon:yes gene_type:complete
MKDDLDIYEKQGLGARMGFGQNPALVIVDFINGFNDPDAFGGGNIQDAIDNTEKLLAAARHLGLPIAYTVHCYSEDGAEDGVFNLKMPKLREGLVRGTHATQVVDQLEPRSGERVVEKHFPSAFFGTDLAGWLAMRQVDTAIVTGCTTSGCVRATVVDSMGNGFRPIVPKECVGDRAAGPHEANLFDMDQKYADVMPLSEVLDELNDLYPGQSQSNKEKDNE